jgi:hypothetical protein
MSIYHDWTSVSGTFTNPGNAFDGSYGDVSTYASGATVLSNSKTHTWQASTSVTGMTSVTLKIRQYWTTGGGDTPGSIALDYSWDGSTWNRLLTAVNGTDADKTDTTEQSYALSGFTGTTNLNTLQIRATAEPGSTYDDSIHKTVFSTTTYNIYDLAVDVVASASIDAVNHGTSPTALYMPSQFSSITGTMTGVGTTPAAIGSGVGALLFFTGSIG